MVKDRKELLEVAGSNANQLKTHLRRAVGGFLEAQRVTPQELAYVLGISEAEMAQILEGDGNVTVDVLSKLLVATDLAVEIKPVGKTPMGAYGRNMPRGGAFPGPNGIPVDENGRPLPPPPGFMRGQFGPMPMGGMRKPMARPTIEEVPMETTEPKRDSKGRFVKKQPAVRRTATQRPSDFDENPNPYFNLSDAELINIIRQNIWDGEIDIEHATHSELAGFVANKERIMRERQEQPERKQEEVRPQNTTPQGGGDALNQFLEMLGNVAKEAQSNPQLMDTISRFMPKRG